MKTLLSFCLLLGFTYQALAQYCTSGGPTSTVDSNVQSVSLTGNSGTISYTGCPGVVGVQDLTATQQTTLAAGLSYSISVQFGTCGGNYSGVGCVWIDYNHDFVFDATEVLGTWQGIPPTPLSTFNFTVPGNAIAGSTRMRVMQREAGTLPLDPCGSFAWGSVTDFTINITGGIDCSGYPGDTKEDAIPITSVPFTTTGATDYCYYNQNLVYQSPDIYYLLTPDTTLVEATVSLCGSGFDTFLSVIRPDNSVVVYNDDQCGQQSQVTFSTVGEDSLYIIVEGWGQQQGAFSLNINGQTLSATQLEQTNFVLYPNPATDLVWIKGTTADQIEVLDLQGHVVLKSLGEDHFSVADLPNGAYLVRLSSANGIANSTLMIQR